MATEDYVSFETAKLLKEKGFDEECEHAYFNGAFFNKEEYGFVLGDDFTVGDLVFAPTLQMAMKWLREEKKLNIEVTIVFDRDGGEWHFVYGFNIISLTPPDYEVKAEDDYPGFETYEEACEASIKYCLENLI